MLCQHFILIVISACACAEVSLDTQESLKKELFFYNYCDNYQVCLKPKELAVVHIVETSELNEECLRLCTTKTRQPDININDIQNIRLESLLLQSTLKIVEFLTENLRLIFLSLILGFVLLVLVKCYWCPAIYVKNLSDVGFEHIPKGTTRFEKINRVRSSRKLGTKLPPPYPNGWFAVAESRELSNGQVTYVSVLGENLVIYRSEKGEVRCVDAYCPHLGANMGLGGKVRGDCIECPFHEWRFNGDGICTSIPGQENPPRGVSIKSWITIEVDYIIWIWYDAENRQPLWSMETVPELQTWGYRGRNEFIINTHVQDVTENGADLAHLNVIHAPSLLTNLAVKYPFLASIVGYHSWTAESGVKKDNTFVLNLKHDYKIGKLSVFHIDITSIQIGPAQVRMRVHTLGGPMMVLMTVTPISCLEQKAVFRFYSPTFNAPIAVAFMLGESYQFERDVAIWNHKTYEGSPCYSKTDKVLRAFRNWFLQFYSEKSISFKDAINKQNNPLDW